MLAVEPGSRVPSCRTVQLVGVEKAPDRLSGACGTFARSEIDLIATGYFDFDLDVLWQCIEKPIKR